MKKLLPKSAHNPSGFTLVELLVVISIIAILSVVGITLFSGTQKGARDARRRGDIESLSKAYEANYTASSATPYRVLTNADFAGGTVPVDPQNSGQFTYSGILAGSSATYTICARMETGTGGNSSDAAGAPQANGLYYCRKNQQ